MTGHENFRTFSPGNLAWTIETIEDAERHGLGLTKTKSFPEGGEGLEEMPEAESTQLNQTVLQSNANENVDTADAVDANFYLDDPYREISSWRLA